MYKNVYTQYWLLHIYNKYLQVYNKNIDLFYDDIEILKLSLQDFVKENILPAPTSDGVIPFLRR